MIPDLQKRVHDLSFLWLNFYSQWRGGGGRGRGGGGEKSIMVGKGKNYSDPSFTISNLTFVNKEKITDINACH